MRLPNMTCHELAERLQSIQPELEPAQVARLCLLILNQCDGPEQLRDEAQLVAAWKNANFRLDASTDQHAAVAEELERMCTDGPVRFTPDQLWILLRAVKVQSQILELYTCHPALA